jgi:hypothetical protein
MGPLFYKGFVAEVSMKLIKNHALTGRLGQDVLRVDIGVLPRPSYFDQAIFLEAHTERSSIAAACVEYDSRACPWDLGVNPKAKNGRRVDVRWRFMSRYCQLARKVLLHFAPFLPRQ